MEYRQSKSSLRAPLLSPSEALNTTSEHSFFSNTFTTDLPANRGFINLKKTKWRYLVLFLSCFSYMARY